jgi:hypothetical protein
LVAVADRLNHQVTQRFAIKLELAKHIEDLPTKRLPGLFELFQ